MFVGMYQKIAAAAAALLALAATAASIFYAGKKKAEANVADERADEKVIAGLNKAHEIKAASDKEVDSVKGANDVAKNINMLNDDAAVNQLRDQWSRD